MDSDHLELLLQLLRDRDDMEVFIAPHEILILCPRTFKSKDSLDIRIERSESYSTVKINGKKTLDIIEHDQFSLILEACRIAQNRSFENATDLLWGKVAVHLK